MAFKNDLSADYIRSLLDYDPETGIFRFRVRLGGRASIGKIAGCLDRKRYHRLKINGHLYNASRVAWLHVTGEWPLRLIDHIDGDPSNTRFANLRPATYTENARNSRKTTRNTSGYKGVSYKKDRNKYAAHIRINGKLKHLGYSNTPEGAAKLYNDAAKEHFGDFVRT